MHDGEPAQHRAEAGAEGVVPPVAARTRPSGRCRPRARTVPTSAAWLAPGASGSCRWRTSGPNDADRLEGARGRLHDRWRWAPSTRCSGPACSGRPPTIPGSGGGPSHGAMIRASTPELAQRARRARAPGPARRRTATASRGTTASPADAALRTASPPGIIASDSVPRLAPDRCPCGAVAPRPRPGGTSGWSADHAGATRIRSLGQLGCMRCQCSGSARMSSSKRCARSWVTRVTSSRIRPRRSVGTGGWMSRK